MFFSSPGRRRKLSDIELKKKKKENMITSCILADILIIYLSMLLGYGLVTNAGSNVFLVFEDVIAAFPSNFYRILPTSPALVALGIAVSALVDVVLFDSYTKKKDIVKKAHGDAMFEEDFLSHDREFVIDPAIVKKVTGKEPQFVYDEEHKKIVTKPNIKNNLKDKIYRECWRQTQLYADKVALSLNGNWAQRNSNAMIFGASGSGKSRFFLNPNLLQANSNYVVTDPSGEIMLGYGAFLEKKEGYIVKCLNISDMEHSCRFNPLEYIKDQSDIPVIVTTLMENTQKQKGGGGDGDFWQKTTQALLCAIIGYLYEVEPIERRNFYNVLEMLRMAQVDEDDPDQEETDFDKMFAVLGQRNPNSYAFRQYQTYSLAPRKTALNILISTAVLLSTYIDIPEFNNLTFKDEMELDKIGAAPYKLADGATLFSEDEAYYKERYASGKLKPGYIDVEHFKKYEEIIARDKLGRYIEGDPYKVAVFLCIPTADTTYNWMVAMLYSLVFKMIYRRGEARAKEQVTSSPKLAFPARLLIDECANIGKIPNLQEYLATCRKYGISIVPIFQSFSQISKLYGKEDANSIYANCDTTLFLGGVDEDTLKIVTNRLGKETVEAQSRGTSGGGKSKGSSTNVQQVGRELMSRIQVEQMSNSECLVFIRALKPFKVKKFNLNSHPNYKYTAEADPENYSFVNPFTCEYDDEAIERIRLKKIGEDGYTAPKEVYSARLRATKSSLQKEVVEMALSLQRAASNYATFRPDDQQSRMNHDLFVSELRSTYEKAVEIGSEHAIDIISNTCYHYNLDIGIEFSNRHSDSYNRISSPADRGDIRRELFSEENNMRELDEMEALEMLKANTVVGSSVFHSITSEFDLATMDQVVSGGLLNMTKSAALSKLRFDTENVSTVTYLDTFDENEQSLSALRSELKDAQELPPEYYGQDLEEYVANIDDDEERSIEDTVHRALFEDSQLPEGVNEEDSTIPTEEELESAINEAFDFSGVKEEDYFIEDESGRYGDVSFEDNDALIISGDEVDFSTENSIKNIEATSNPEKVEAVSSETIFKNKNNTSAPEEKPEIVKDVPQPTDIAPKKKFSAFMVSFDDDDDDE